MSTIISSRWSGVLAAAAIFACLPLSVRAQFVQDINGLKENTYFFQCCGSDLTITNNYPTLAKFDEQFTTAAMGADASNRHEFLFSSNGGANARIFNNNDSFDVSVDLVLEAGTNIPRKEAGIRLNRSFQDGLFFVTTNEGALETGEIVACCGPLPFFSFDNPPDDPLNPGFGIRYIPGTPISLRMIYNEPGPDPVNTESDRGTIEYLVEYLGNSYTSGEIMFANNEYGIVNGNVAGAYMQATPSPSNPTADFGIATFTNFVFGTGEVGLEGDYNHDGTVDAADYVVWRKTDGNNPAGYNTWRANFGMMGPGSASALGEGGTAVPEPATLALAFIALLGMLGLLRRC